MNEWVVIYGIGTPSAYVSDSGLTEEEARSRLASRRKTWGSNGYRYTVHRAVDVLALDDEGDVTLLKTAMRPREPQGPNRS